jgi:hypothetical protein
LQGRQLGERQRGREREKLGTAREMTVLGTDYSATWAMQETMCTGQCVRAVRAVRDRVRRTASSVRKVSARNSCRLLHYVSSFLALSFLAPSFLAPSHHFAIWHHRFWHYRDEVSFAVYSHTVAVVSGAVVSRAIAMLFPSVSTPALSYPTISHCRFLHCCFSRHRFTYPAQSSPALLRCRFLLYRLAHCRCLAQCRHLSLRIVSRFLRCRILRHRTVVSRAIALSYPAPSHCRIPRHRTVVFRAIVSRTVALLSCAALSFLALA